MQICLTLPFSLKARAFLVHYSEKAFIELTFALLFSLLFLHAIKTIAMLITYSWGFVIRIRLIFDLKVLQSNENYQLDFRAGRKYFKYLKHDETSHLFCFQNVFLQMNMPFILSCRMKISWIKWFKSVLSCPNSWFLHATPFRANIV